MVCLGWPNSKPIFLYLNYYGFIFCDDINLLVAHMQMQMQTQALKYVAIYVYVLVL